MVDIVQDIGRNSGRQVRAGVGRLGGGGGVLGGGVLGGGGPHGTNDDFWLPKVRHFAAQLLVRFPNPLPGSDIHGSWGT